MSNVVHPEKESIVSDSTSNKPDQEAEGLSFFTANDNDTSSESDSDEETGKISANINGSTEPQATDKNKLPSPSTLFATVGKPKFLDRPLEDEEVDWASLSKRYEPLFEYSSVSYPGETVDLTSAERAEATISGAPVKYKAEISETKRHLFLHGKRSVDLSSAAEGPSTGAQGMNGTRVAAGEILVAWAVYSVLPLTTDTMVNTLEAQLVRKLVPLLSMTIHHPTSS